MLLVFFFFHDVFELGDLDKLAKQKSKAILFFLMKQDALYFFFIRVALSHYFVAITIRAVVFNIQEYVLIVK